MYQDSLHCFVFTGIYRLYKRRPNEFGPGNATGKVVMVSLNVSLPPIEETTPTGRYPTVKPFFKNENNSDSSFTVVLEQEQRTAATRVSDGTTKLHNLWLFQFNENGSINGNPHKLSDTATAINDMVTIDVPLVCSREADFISVGTGT